MKYKKIYTLFIIITSLLSIIFGIMAIVEENSKLSPISSFFGGFTIILAIYYHKVKNSKS